MTAKSNENINRVKKKIKCIYTIFIHIVLLLLAVMTYIFYIEKSDVVKLWRVDPIFSSNLTYLSNSYSRAGGKSKNKIVKNIQIYQLTDKKKSFYSLNELTKRHPVIETYNESEIDRILMGLKQRIDTPHCVRIVKSFSFHILVYDAVLHRVGYIQIFLCQRENDRYVAIVNALQNENNFTSTIYYNEDILLTLDALGFNWKAEIPI